YVPFIGERDVAGVLRAVPQAAKLLRRHRIDRVVSTGSAIALAYLPTAAAIGLETHYIESSTRVTSCSVTGRLLARTRGVRCWWQYEPAPNGFTSLPGVYARYRSEPATDPVLIGGGTTAEPPLDRVVVTVGTTDRCFRRLITRLVEILPADAQVLWQTGHSRVDDLPIDARRLVPEDELVAAVAEADVVVSHAGAGSLALALAAGTCPVFVPRRAAAGEQIDDHQVELADWAADRDLAVVAEADRVELSDLRRAAARRIVAEPTEELVLT
ncbi:MAG: glycosyltransferase, partial [Actinomycetota bacterium]